MTNDYTNCKDESTVAYFEEIVIETHTTAGKSFGANARPIYDSGAGKSVCAKRGVPNHTIQPTDHPGFTGAAGETIPADGKVTVAVRDRVIGTEGTLNFTVATQVTRPIIAGGETCDAGHIAIQSATGCFIVDEAIARPMCEALKPHAKLTFSRAKTGSRLYGLDAELKTQLQTQH